MSQERNVRVARLIQLASSKQQQRLTTVATLADKTIASYTYDENGLRLTKTIGDTTHEYFYNNEVLEMEVVKVNDVITEYRSYKWSGYTPLSMIVKAKNDAGEFDTKAYQFITNHRGDVLSIRDKDDQEVGAYTYDAYGNVLTVEGDLAKANPIRYAGYYYDEETKNYYLQARYYNPANGAFLALDPHPGDDDDDPLSQNGYTYGDNSPVIKIDPDGNDAIWLTAKNAAFGNGHTAILFQNYGSWYYFSFASSDGSMYSKAKVVFKKIKLPKKLSQVNNVVGYYYNFTSSTYIKGNFNRSYELANKIKKGNKRYDLFFYNCLTVAADILSYSNYKKTRYSFTLARNITQPNTAAKVIKKSFGNSSYRK